jgi:hypothetical protein
LGESQGWMGTPGAARRISGPPSTIAIPQSGEKKKKKKKKKKTQTQKKKNRRGTA